MSPTLLLLLLLLLVIPSRPSEAQMSTSTSEEEQRNVSLSFQPTVAVVVGVFSIMFFLTVLLLVYAKFCHSENVVGTDPPGFNPRHVGVKSSGLDKAVIEALPFFPFSMLKGSKEALECAVCLSRFEDSEVLRLLPKCKHAFHIDCVDQWLEAHSSCPLCRCKVEEADATLFNYSTSSRFLFRDPSNKMEADLELYVEREANSTGERRRSSQYTFQHRIVIPDSVFRNRWSDLSSADLMSLLGCDVLRLSHGDCTEAALTGEREPSNGKRVVETGKIRCMSEIASVTRFVDVSKEEERVRKAWWPIAWRTAERVAGGDWGPPLPEV